MAGGRAWKALPWILFILICIGSQMFIPSVAHGLVEIIGIARPVAGGCDADADADADGLSNCEEDANGNGVVDEGETDPQKADTDADGIIDGEEGDRDGDGELGPDESDPLIADTDNDGVPDGVERRIGTLPNKCDTDEDGLSDGVELGYIQPEVIGDGCHGLTAAGTNYRNPYAMDALNPDSDFDGLQDGEEDKNGNGWVDPDETDPSIVDTDGDGLSDYVETTGDFDGDGLPDFDFQTIKGEGDCMPPQELADLDCDGVPNARDDDSDNDGCPDAQEGGWLDANADGIPDIYDKDAKLCPEPAADAGGGAGGGGDAEETDSGLGEGPRYPTDGGACSLIASIGENNDPSAKAVFIIIILTIAVFSTARPFIRQTY